MNLTVTRRSALAGAGTVIVGAVIGFVYGRNSDATKPAASGYTGGSSYGGASGGANAALAPLAAVPDGGGLITSGVVITRTAGRVHAFSSTCTHLGCTVNKVTKGKIYCPCHGSVFSAQSGAVEQGPATRPLPAVQVTVRNGMVYRA